MGYWGWFKNVFFLFLNENMCSRRDGSNDGSQNVVFNGEILLIFSKLSLFPLLIWSTDIRCRHGDRDMMKLAFKIYKYDLETVRMYKQPNCLCELYFVLYSIGIGKFLWYGIIKWNARQWSATNTINPYPTRKCKVQNHLAHQIRISACFTWTDDSYLTHVISPRTG